MILLMLLLTLRLLLMDWSWLGLHVTWLVGERCTQLKHPPPTPYNWLSCKYEYCANIDILICILHLKRNMNLNFLPILSFLKEQDADNKGPVGGLGGGWHNEGWGGEWRRRWSWEINLVHCGRAASQPHQVPLSKKGGQGTEGAGWLFGTKWIERIWPI